MARDYFLSETELLSYDLILESTLHVAGALYSSLVCTEFLSCLNCDVLLVNLLDSLGVPPENILYDNFGA